MPCRALYWQAVLNELCNLKLVIPASDAVIKGCGDGLLYSQLILKQTIVSDGPML